MEALIISCLHLTDIATRSKTNSGVRLAMFISKLTAYHSNYLEQTKDVSVHRFKSQPQIVGRMSVSYPLCETAWLYLQC